MKWIFDDLGNANNIYFLSLIATAQDVQLNKLERWMAINDWTDVLQPWVKCVIHGEDVGGGIWEPPTLSFMVDSFQLPYQCVGKLRVLCCCHTGIHKTDKLKEPLLQVVLSRQLLVRIPMISWPQWARLLTGYSVLVKLMVAETRR